MRPRIFIAGPYSLGNLEDNVNAAIDAGQIAYARGWAPFIPHLTHYWDKRHPGSYEQWTALDLVWLECCDAIVRLPGESPGADRELIAAEKLGLDPFLGIDDVPDALEWLADRAS